MRNEYEVVSDDLRTAPRAMFNRRHYRKIAEALAGVRPYQIGLVREEWDAVCRAFIRTFSEDNPRFDRERFLVWCNTK